MVDRLPETYNDLCVVTVFQLVQRYFSAWYSVIVSQRIKVGKARAMSDWRCKLRAWNAWRAYVNHIKSDREAHAVTMEMKEKHRLAFLASFTM